jgi:sec-independent protein translocase protein TatB
VFGISLTEILLVMMVAIVVVGPQKLPRMLATVGNAVGRLRRLASEMRRQTGIDDVLRAEGLDGGLSELRNIMRGDIVGRGPRGSAAASLYDEHVEYDRTREYPIEGPDSFGAIPEDLLATPDDPKGPPQATS